MWRDTGCEAHFILWRDRLIWCGPLSRFATEPEYDGALESQVLEALSDEFRSAEELSLLIDEVPWEITRTAERLTRQGRAEMRRNDEDEFFRRVPDTLPNSLADDSQIAEEKTSFSARARRFLRKIGF